MGNKIHHRKTRRGTVHKYDCQNPKYSEHFTIVMMQKSEKLFLLIICRCLSVIFRLLFDSLGL